MLLYYRLLGVSRDAPAQDIKKAYHRLARRWHPDSNNGHPVFQHRFRLLAEAYEVLSDDERRRAYDRHGTVALVRGADRPGVSGRIERLAASLSGFLDSKMKQVPKRGRDTRATLEVPFEMACLGGQLTLPIVQRQLCTDCRGSRAATGSALEACHVCHGERVVSQDGLLGVTTPCPFCGGSGVLAVEPCAGCAGDGERDVTLSLPVEVPPAVDPGRRLVMRGYGEPGHAGGPPGDLFVELRIRLHAVLTREGADLRCVVPISLLDAMVGAEIRVPYIDGTHLTLRVPSGTQSGLALRVRERGLAVGGKRGDLLVELQVETPRLTDARDQAALVELLSRASHPRKQAFEAATRRGTA